MGEDFAILLKMQAYLAQMLELPPTAFAAHYKHRLKKKIAKCRKKLQNTLCTQSADTPSAELVVSRYWEQLPTSDRQRAALDRIYMHIERRVSKLKRRTRRRLKSLFSREEELGESLDLASVHTVVRGPFRKYFLTKKLVEYMQGFLRRTRMKRAAGECVERTEIRCIDDLLMRAHCLHCNKAISLNVLPYHLKGKDHLRKVEAGAIFKETCSDVQNVPAENGLFTVDESELLCMARDLKTLVKSLCGVRYRGLHELNADVLIDLACLLESQSAKARPESLRARKTTHVRARKEPSFYCEVCDSCIAGTSDFYAHFLGERHVQSLEALGAANVQRCFGVSRIALVKKLIENVEEVEDADGNVYDKRTYDDLARHGLI